VVRDLAELRCLSYLLSYRKSKVPVWSDTLLPEFPNLASAIKCAHQMNHQTSSPKRKRQSVERHSTESSLKINNNINMDTNEPKLLRHSLENPRIQDWAGEVEIVEPPTMSFRNSSSPTPMSFFHHGDHPSTTVVSTRALICFDSEVVPHMEDSESITSVIPQQKTQKTSAMDVDTPTPSQPPPKPVRRMIFKPLLPGRRNQPKISSVQTSTLLTSDSAEPLSTSLPVVDGHSKKDELEVTSRAQDVVLLQEKPTLPRPRLPLPSKNCTPTPPSPSPRHHRDAQKLEIPDTRVSLPKDGNATDTDTDAELVVDLLLRGTPEEPHNRSCLSSPLQQEIIEDLPLHRGQDDKDDNNNKHDEPSVVKDTAAVEGLATQFLQRSATPFLFSVISP
jgi:hypothetical protein